MMPAFDITEKTESFNNLAAGRPKELSRTFRIALVALTGLIAVSVPKFGLFINLTGSFACTALAFVMPVSLFLT